MSRLPATKPIKPLKTIEAYRHFSVHESEIDQRPGRYYVSARDGTRTALLLGPFAQHQQALAAVPVGMACAHQHDPVHAPWCAYGTCRLADEETKVRPGIYNHVQIAQAAELVIDLSLCTSEVA
ncbi:MAG: hypothetical protein IPO08_23840 [Xanthomonadales bacterium]|nr:hypothetical protein [Xanthomonadales bacterium]